MRRLLSLYITFLLSLLTVTTPSSAQIITNQAVPDVVVQTGNQSVQLRALTGQVVYVDFWASWCGPCRKSFPWMNELQSRYGAKGLKVIAINVDSDPQQARAFLQEHPARFDVAYDAQGKIASQFGLSVMPSSYLIDKQGKVILIHKGFLEKDVAELERLIQSALAK